MLHHLKIPDGFVAWILTHRAVVLVGISLATLLAVTALWGVPVRVSLLQGLMPDETQYQACLERASTLGGSSDDLVYVATREGDKLFTPRVLNSIRDAARQLEKLPEIDCVFSIVDLPRLVIDGPLCSREIAIRAVLRRQLARGRVPDLKRKTIWQQRYWPESENRRQPVQSRAVGELMRKDPIARRLLSRDGTAHTMLVWLADSSSLHNRPQSGIRKDIQSILSRHQLGTGGMYCAGTLVMQDWMFDEVIRSFCVALPLVAVIVCVLVYLIFHRLSYVVITLVIAAIAIIWTLGVVAIAFGSITLLVAATPALILIISTADTVHLLSAFVAELQNGLTRHQAIRKAFREVGGACLLTSVTTFVGFLSLTVVPAVTVRHMALACAVGVASALLLALTLVPIALTVLKPPRVDNSSQSLVNRCLAVAVASCRRRSLIFPRTVLVAHLLIILGAACAALGLKFDADLPARFVRGHPIRESIDFFHREMFGTTAVEIIVQTGPESLLAPGTVAGLAEFQRKLEALPEVQDVISLVTVFRIAHRLVGFQAPDGLPETEASAGAVLELARRTNPGAVNGLISQDAGLLRVLVRVSPVRVMEVVRCGQRFQAIGRDCLPQDATVTTSGFHLVVGHAAQEILRSQAKGFLLCFASVMAVVTLGVRSLRLSLLAVLPNLFPLVLLGGILGLTCDVVDFDVLGIAIVSFGLAIDDTIHFLHRYDIERPSAGSRRAALERTFQYTGSAIVRTTVILGIGLLPFWLSGYLSIRLMGTYLVFVLGCAVLGDLLLLPALILLFGGDRKSGKCEPRTGLQTVDRANP